MAEEQVVHVREEIEQVKGQLNTLQHRHELEMRELHQQLAERTAT